MILITYDSLVPGPVIERAMSPSDGAVVTFLGVTRDASAGRKVLYLEYEAYIPMAEKKLNEIEQEMRLRWPVNKVSIIHRLGHLAIGETSLIIAVASPHRQEAFAACQYAVDRIKQVVPIWKKEYFEGGEVWVESPEDHATRSH